MNELQKKYGGDAHFRTEQMMKEIDKEIYKEGHDSVIFLVRENELIYVGVLADQIATNWNWKSNGVRKVLTDHLNLLLLILTTGMMY